MQDIKHLRIQVINHKVDTNNKKYDSLQNTPNFLYTQKSHVYNQKLVRNNIWLRRFASQEQALWKEIIKARFGIEDKWTTYLPTQPYGTGVWRSIRNQWINFANSRKIKVGNGGGTLFGKMSWWNRKLWRTSLQNCSAWFFKRYLQSEKWETIKGSILDLGHFNDWEINKVAELLNTLEQYKDINSNEDNLFWLPDKRFSLQEIRLTVRWLAIGRWSGKVKAPFKVACFTWLLAKQAAVPRTTLWKEDFKYAPGVLFVNLS